MARQAVQTPKANVSTVAPLSGDMVLVPAPKLRRMLGISAVTLWRWRHDPKLAFPSAKQINNRIFFVWADVEDWVARQEQAA